MASDIEKGGDPIPFKKGAIKRVLLGLEKLSSREGEVSIFTGGSKKKKGGK